MPFLVPLKGASEQFGKKSRPLLKKGRSGGASKQGLQDGDCPRKDKRIGIA
jgi:hypothetical protein